MKALVYNTDFENNYKLVERKKPKILEPKDVILQVTLSSICTSDLHIIQGAVPRANNDIVLGHEYVGKVVEVGADVKNLKVGDRVSANCETFCGECFFCKRGYINNCEKAAGKSVAELMVVKVNMLEFLMLIMLLINYPIMLLT